MTPFHHSISGGPGLIRSAGRNGVVLTPYNRAKPSRRAAAAPAPFALYDASSGGTLKVGVRPGMVGNFIPTIGGTSIVAVPAPALTVTGSTGIIYLDATVDAAGAITALIIANAASIPADTATQKRKLVGTWTASGGAFTSVVSILDANQTLYLCNGTALWEA